MTKQITIDDRDIPALIEFYQSKKAKIVAELDSVNMVITQLLNTAKPKPVSSDRTPRNCADVVAANCDRGLPVTPHVAHA